MEHFPSIISSNSQNSLSIAKKYNIFLIKPVNTYKTYCRIISANTFHLTSQKTFLPGEVRNFPVISYHQIISVSQYAVKHYATMPFLHRQSIITIYQKPPFIYQSNQSTKLLSSKVQNFLTKQTFWYFWLTLINGFYESSYSVNTTIKTQSQDVSYK